MASARTGRARSVFVVIAFGVAGFRSVFSFFVENRLGDDIFFHGPVSEIEQTAAFAAKREVGVGRGVHRLAADWALIFHVGGAALNWIRWRSAWIVAALGRKRTGVGAARERKRRAE